MSPVVPCHQAPLTRWRVRAAAARAGLGEALGGPQPNGRRVAVQVADGALIACHDVSACWRGHLLWSEAVRPAPAWAAAAWALADALEVSALTVTLDDSDEALTVIDVSDQPLPIPSATIHAGEPADVCTWRPLLTLPVADRATLAQALTRLSDPGQRSTVGLLRACLDAMGPRNLHHRDLDGVPYAPCAIQVLNGGLHTTVQDWPGRQGHWAVGVPPSGPFDDWSFRLANRLVGNADGAPGLELTLTGPTLRFHVPAIIALAGATVEATIDGAAVPMWQALVVPAGAVLRLGGLTGQGVRCSVAVRGGLNVPSYLGAAATFDLGGFGGVTGKPLATGDWLPLMRSVPAEELAACPPPLPSAVRPRCERTWTIGVLEGPHAAPDFLTPAGLREFYATRWSVHHHSNRTGVRLVGPKPGWARTDGGDAGLHPSNIHDNAYAFGAVDLTGDMPIILGPDGPSCGGFVCPMVVAMAERWKLGQLRPGDGVRFVALTPAQADELRVVQELPVAKRAPVPRPAGAPGAVLMRRRESPGRPFLCIRRAGDDFTLLEYGPTELDLALRLRVAVLEAALRARAVPGIIDLVPGVRSLQVHHDPRVLGTTQVVDLLVELDDGLPNADAVSVPSRLVHLPLSWDDPSTRKAIDIYIKSVRADAPWCPWNIEFIRRINGLSSVAEVHRIVFAAEYLVLGLGDVYLGAPVATPVDPRHRLVTTKYNPARTWTPENAVGIGGAYLCIYGMEGPGGYQFVGRTVPVWRREDPQPALLRTFDRLKWYEVSHEELQDLRADCRAGRWQPRCEEGVFDGAAYARMLHDQAPGIAAFRTSQQAAFQAERTRWDQA